MLGLVWSLSQCIEILHKFLSCPLQVCHLSLTPSLLPDGLKADLCHAPITPSTVQQVLERFNMVEGHFLVRESRSSDNAFTLSLCHNQEILSFRIVKHRDGMLSFVNPQNHELDDMDENSEPSETFHTLDALIKWHLHTKVSDVCVGWGRSMSAQREREEGEGGEEGGENEGGRERRGRGRRVRKRRERGRRGRGRRGRGRRGREEE